MSTSSRDPVTPPVVYSVAAPFNYEDYGANLRNALIHVHHNGPTSPSENEYVSFHVPSPAVRQALHRRFLFQTPDDFDFAWYAASNAYVQGLDKYEKYILRAYTRYGDEVVNTYLRSPTQEAFFANRRVQNLLFDMEKHSDMHTLALHLLDAYGEESLSSYFSSSGELLSTGSAELEQIVERLQDGGEDVHDLFYGMLDNFVGHLRDILLRAPRSQHPLRVFRGVRKDYLPATETAVTQAGFVSTTFSVDAALKFANKNKLLYELLVQPNTPCLSLVSISRFHREYEILLAPETFAVAGPREPTFPLHTVEFEGVIAGTHFLHPETYPYVRRIVTVAHAESTDAAAAAAATPTTGGRALPLSRSTRRTKAATKVATKATKVHSKRLGTRRRLTPHPLLPFWRERANMDPVIVPTAVPPRIRDLLLRALRRALR